MDLSAVLMESSEELRTRTSEARRKEWGQYFTPAPIADLMAGFATSGLDGSRTIRVLDPGAGSGLLGVTASARILRRADERTRVHLVAVESEPQAAKVLRQNLIRVSDQFGPKFSFEVIEADFLTLADSFAGSAIQPFDVAISNPPYFKLSPTDRRGGTAPNIYARFMEVTAKFLRRGGRLCFIIPRSYASGRYFRTFRRRFHSGMSLTRIHLFRSRGEAFRGDGVLQENVIIHALKELPDPETIVEISISDGLTDLHEPSTFKAPLGRVVDVRVGESWLHLFESERDLAVAKAIETLPSNLRDLGLQISTGPVVPFRAREYLVDSAEGGAVPLLWLQHVRPGAVTWPLPGDFRKPEYLSPKSPPKLRVPNHTCVLLRRFSAKEQPRRLTAAPLERGQLHGEFIGVENHLNVISGVDREMHSSEAVGLAALFNSGLYDSYFRIVNGNTQVSASEIRAMRLPDRSVLCRIGERAAAGGAEAVDALLGEVLDVAG